jgi:hypothetical protein
MTIFFTSCSDKPKFRICEVRIGEALLYGFCENRMIPLPKQPLLSMSCLIFEARWLQQLPRCNQNIQFDFLKLISIINNQDIKLDLSKPPTYLPWSRDKRRREKKMPCIRPCSLRCVSITKYRDVPVAKDHAVKTIDWVEVNIHTFLISTLDSGKRSESRATGAHWWKAGWTSPRGVMVKRRILALLAMDSLSWSLYAVTLLPTKKSYFLPYCFLLNCEILKRKLQLA